MIRGEYTYVEYAGDDYDWWVDFDYDGDFCLQGIKTSGHPKGCTDKKFKELMNKFKDDHEGYSSIEVDNDFEQLAEKEGWE